jgi:Zn-dependent protease with chaperone function
VDFFDAQERARRLSYGLILLFLLAVVCMVAIVYVTVAFGLGLAPGMMVRGGGMPVGGIQWPGLDPGLLGLVSAGMGTVIGGGTAWRTAQLSRGGAAVAELLGGRRVEADTGDPRERVLLNVVEEMSIASGVPVPEVFLLEGEAGINAFAAGHTPADAAVAVTRGALETLTRDELQGVVAHEFSHILNGDMRLNVRLMGLLAGILLLSVVGRVILRGSFRGRYRGSGRRGGAGQVAILGVVLLLLGYLGVVFGRLIQAAVSRQREFLADAAAVEFTRNPAGLAGALKRIGAAAEGSRIQDAHAVEAGHLFFAGGAARTLSRLTATHPPLEERIRRIDPRWDGSFEGVPSSPVPRPAPTTGGGSSAAVGFAAGSATTAGSLLASAGNPGPAHVVHARAFLGSVPPALREAVRGPEGSLATLLALLLDGDPAVRGRQTAAVVESLGERAARHAEELRPLAEGLGPAGRLPLLELALPALRALPRERAGALRSAVRSLVQADGRVNTFEFALFHLLQRALPAGGGRPPRRPGTVPLERLGSEAELLLSAVARAGRGSEAELSRAFAAGWVRVGSPRDARLLPVAALGLDQVDGALSRLEAAAPRARRRLLEAALEVVQTDGRVDAEEAELVRAMAEALDVPIPPILPDRSRGSGPPEAAPG